MSVTSHPRLIERHRRQPPPEATWTRADTWFVVLILAAVAFCAIVPFAVL